MPILKNYQQGVLINNWFEDLVLKNKEEKIRNARYRIDHQQAGYQKPDAIIPRGAVTDGGKPPAFLVEKHDQRHMDNLITWNDQDYGKCPRDDPRNQLPPLRHFDRHVLKWVPERSDFPQQGRPTSWGLLEQKRAQWTKEMESQNLGRTPMSDYKQEFNPFSTAYLKETVRKKYDIAALTASSTVPLGKPLDPIFVAEHCKRP